MPADHKVIDINLPGTQDAVAAGEPPAVWLEFRVALYQPLGIGLNKAKGNVCAFKPGAAADQYNQSVAKDESWNKIQRGDWLLSLQREHGPTISLKGLDTDAIAKLVKEQTELQPGKPIKLCFRGLRKMPTGEERSSSPLQLPELVTPRSQRPSPAKVSPSLAGPKSKVSPSLVNLSPASPPKERPQPTPFRQEAVPINKDIQGDHLLRPTPGTADRKAHSKENRTDSVNAQWDASPSGLAATPSAALPLSASPLGAPSSASPTLTEQPSNPSPQASKPSPQLVKPCPQVANKPSPQDTPAPRSERKCLSPRETGSASSSSKESPELLALKETLADPNLHTAFIAHTKRKFCAENVAFLDAVSEYERLVQQINNPVDEDLRQCGRNVCKSFIAQGAEKQVNLPSWLQEAISAQMEAGEFNSQLFSKSKKEIFNLLLRDVFPSFMPEYESLKASAKPKTPTQPGKTKTPMSAAASHSKLLPR
eukprot:g39713.t1